MQIIHTCGNHWILASNIGCEEGRVKVYNSFYKSVDEQRPPCFTRQTICVVDSQKPDGGVDCDVFAIATATSLAHGVHLATFDQSAMRKDLLDCFTLGVMTIFPCTCNFRLCFEIVIKFNHPLGSNWFNNTKP